MNGRLHRPSYLSKVMKNPEDLLNMFHNGQYIAWSGFTGVGYPKLSPRLLMNHVEKNNLQGKMKFNLFVGASSGAEIENKWADLDMIDRRSPHQVGKSIQKGINEGRIRFADRHLSEFPQDLMYGYYTKDKQGGKLDIAVVEATEIQSDGTVVLGASVGATPELVAMADKVIIELNSSLPSFSGLHDIVIPELPPHRKALLLNRVDDRIGSNGIRIDPDKIVAIVESNGPDATTPSAPIDAVSAAIAQHILNFFKFEVAAGRLPPSLLPLQSGIGDIANAIIGGLAKGEFENVEVWTEVLQDSFLDFFDEGKLRFASATSIRFSPPGFERFYKDWEQYRDKILLRPQQISNHPELVRRLGVIAMNTPVEFDIYGHANSTMVNGSRMLNGLGGSGDFLRNSKLSILHAPSARPTSKDPTGISTILPMVTHCDHTEHDVDVYVTEQGLADLRGLAPRERSRKIIENCAHPDYRDQLLDYVKMAEDYCTKRKSLHEPQMLSKVFKMSESLEKNGTMKLQSWD